MTYRAPWEPLPDGTHPEREVLDELLGRTTSSVEWPRFYDGAIMWREVEEYERPVGCPLCGAAVTDTEAHVRWHEAQS